MGTLYYGNSSEGITVPDWTLAHLRVLATTKLRRSESFSVTWKHGDDERGGRSTIWLHCSIPLRFDFDSAEPEALDRQYLDELAQAATSTAGVTFDLSETAVAAMPARIGRAA